MSFKLRVAIVREVRRKKAANNNWAPRTRTCFWAHDVGGSEEENRPQEAGGTSSSNHARAHVALLHVLEWPAPAGSCGELETRSPEEPSHGVIVKELDSF